MTQFCHTGSFSQNFIQIDSINSCSTSKKVTILTEIVRIIHFLTLKSLEGIFGFILEIIIKIARWRHKSEISERNVKTKIYSLSFLL